MLDVITPGQIAILAVMHLVYLTIIVTIGWFLLAKPYRYVLIGMALVGWVWAVVAMVNFNQQDTGFFSWFLDPSAEKNFTAMLTSIALASIGITALVLFWKTNKAQTTSNTLLLRAYWLLLAAMFCFLAVDEYASIHEHFHLWRQGYLALGGSIASLSLILAVFDKDLRPYIALFIIGLGSLGFAGVMLDAFSNQNIIDIGSFNLTFISCRYEFLGVDCRDYANMEELWELIGATTMWLSLLSIAHHWGQQTITKRVLAVLVGIWAFVIIGWLWFFPLIENQFARPVHIVYDDVTVSGYTISQDTIEAGDVVDVTLYVQVNHSLREDYSMSVHLFTQPQADSLAQADMELGEFNFPTRAWLPALPVRNRFQLHIPDDLPAGVSYQLVVMLWRENPMESIPANESDRPTLLNNQIMVLQGLPALSSEISQSPLNGGYHFEEGFILRGYEIPANLRAGDVVVSRWWWTAENDINTNLTQFVHFTNIETDELFVFDQLPFAGHFPTSDWVAGMNEVDEWQFQLPADMPAAIYRVSSGLYEPASGARMPVTDSDEQPVQDNIIELGDWTIRE